MEIGTYMDTIINSMINQFDFGYMLTINVTTYIVILIIDTLNGDKVLTTWQKRLMLLISIIVVGVTYKIANYPNDIVLLNSSIFAPVFWSWVLKPILTKLGIGYKKVDNYLG